MDNISCFRDKSSNLFLFQSVCIRVHLWLRFFLDFLEIGCIFNKMKKWGFLFAESCGMVLVACSLYGQWENPDKRLTVYPSYLDYGSYNNAWTIAVRDTMVHIVWEHRTGSPGELYYIRSINSGNSFEPDTQLTTRDSHFPSVAVCDSIVHIVWQDARDGNPEIYYNRSVDDGETWGIDNKRLTNDPAHSKYPSVAVCDSIVYVVWIDSRDGNYEIYYNRSVDNGKTWGIGNKRLTDDPAISGYPSVAVRDSIVHVVWIDERNGNYEIYYNRSVDNGETWGITNKRLTDDSAYSGCPSIAVCDSIVHVVWYDWRDGNYEIYYNRSVDNGETWEIIDKRLTNDPADSWYPSVAVCDSIVHVVWWDERAGAGNMEIYYNRSIDNGETWGGDERLTDANGKSLHVSVSCWNCSYDYDVHVTWTDKRDGNYEIYYKRHKCEGTSVEEDYRFKITDLRLEVCPNPFTQRTEIRFQISDARCQVSLKIYDMAGRMIKTLANEERKAGYYNVSFDAEELTTGIYFVKLVVGDYKEIKKLILMK